MGSTNARFGLGGFEDDSTASAISIAKVIAQERGALG
jgi:hypothetical protein